MNRQLPQTQNKTFVYSYDNEVLVKHYDKGREYLKLQRLDRATHNKTIAKACESYRLTKEQKTELKGLKRP